MDVKRFEILPVLESVQLNEKINFQITCLEVNNSDVYLGTADGFILGYQDVLETFVTPQPTPQHRYMSTKKPVTQIKIAPILERLLCVYDATFVALNLNSLEVINSLRIKNIYSFCLNENPMLLEDPFTLELCLVKKKSVCIYHLQADKLTLVKEVTVPEQPILVAMDGYFVCMAAENNYYMLDWQSGESQQLISNDSTSFMSPVCKHVARNEFLINGLSHLGVFVNTSGISERPPIDWGMDVKRIAYSYPFILCLKQYSITIISVIDSQMKEEIPFENGAYIDNFDGKIVIASSDSIFHLRRLPWEEQIDSLLDSGKSQEAIELCDTLSENGLISNRDFESAKLVQVKAELEEISQDNESAFLYGQTGDHAKAFELYLGKHMDHERALKHCMFYSKQENSNETFRILLDVYLDLYKENGPDMVKPLLNLVNHSQCQFDLADTLKLLPNDWPLPTVHRFVMNSLRAAFNRHHQSSMGIVLSQSQLERLKKQKRELSRKPIRLGKDSVCIICNNTIFDSRFVWLPTSQCFLHDFCYSAA